MKRWLLILILFGLLLVAAYLSTGLYQVRPGEQAVVRRFGRVQPEPRGPGLHFGLPWGLDRVDRVGVDERRVIDVGYTSDELTSTDAVPSGQVLTGDHNLINLRVKVYYRVHYEEKGAVVDYVLNADRVEALLARAADTAIASTLAGKKVDEVLLGKAKDLEPLVRERLLEAIAGYKLGVVVESVNLTYAQPPAELVEVFREVSRARSQKELAEREALSFEDSVVNAARREDVSTRDQADAVYRQKVIGALAEADSFRALLKTKDPQTTLMNLYLKQMEYVMSRLQVRTLTESNVTHTIFLPLPEN